MDMRSNIQLLLLLCMIAVTTHAQNEPSPSLNIGDSAPVLQVREWLKGTPVQRFEKGKVYVLEFWAIWCVPCKAAMPHLSALARQYRDRITFLGIDVMERKTTSIKKIRGFVDSMGHRMDYYVAAEDSNFMVAGWMEASGEQGIPSTFVVNAEGRLAWIGHPKDLAGVLPKIVNNTWNIKEALAKRISDKRLRELDLSTHYDLMDYWGKPDSILLAINKIVRDEPGLKYAPFIASNTFNSLIKTNNHLLFNDLLPISVILKDKSTHKGIGKSFYDLDAAYLAFQALAQQAYGRHNILHFECMQISSHSEDVKLYLKKKGRAGKTRYDR